MKRAINIIILIYIILYTSIVYAQEEEKAYQLEPIVVTPYKIPVSFYNSNRSISIIDKEGLEKNTFYSIPKILSHTPGIDIQRRGGFGVPSDISIRGANFEENLILLDGIRINDPQTGHHNLDIPLTINDIERIEILRGHTSGVHGPDGFGGALNIVIKKPKGAGFKGGVSIGENDLLGNNASITFPFLNLNHRLSFEKRRSDGWRDYTKFEVSTFSYNGSLDFEDNNINFLFGWKDNDFEADSFYSSLYPREEEHTDTRFLKLDSSVHLGQFTVEPKLYYRRHADKFILDKERRGWYENFHTSYVYGTELLLHFDSAVGRYTLGTEIAKDKLESTNLGFHSHQREAVLLVASPKIAEKLNLNAAIRYDHFYKWGNEWSPSVDIGYLITDSFRVRSSVGKSFRTPSFTELYYNSPGNIGDDSLTPEEAWSYEAGFGFKERGVEIECDIFRREAEDAIDWTRPGIGSPWQAKNIGELETDGIEVIVSFMPQELNKNFPLRLVSLSYSHLDSDREGTEDLESKYVLNFLRHYASMKMDAKLPFGIGGSIDLSYKDRVGHDGHFLLDTRLYKEYDYKEWRVRFFIDGANLFNTFYTEVKDVSPPGRWIIAGIEMEY